MDYETIDADGFGRSLRGIGVNLLVRDVRAECAFLETVFDLKSHQVTVDFAIVTYGEQVFQLHSDSTLHAYPFLGLFPDSPPRGGGIEMRHYDSDPEFASKVAWVFGAAML